MSTVDRVLSDTGIKVADLDGFAVSIGPGSFTGLRIGLATVKGLALVTKKPVTAVPTLKALAWNLPYSQYPVCPLLDARKKEVYAAIFRFEENVFVQMMEESVISLRELAGRIKERTIFTGEGSHLFRDEIRSLFGDRAVFAPVSAMVPSAASVAGIGMMQLNDGDCADLDSLTPQYIEAGGGSGVGKRSRSR
jgi:tRNA threonylcarbamoyladenosine biosynthesis protein TsaB